jgi:hypothetical protein
LVMYLWTRAMSCLSLLSCRVSSPIWHTFLHRSVLSVLQPSLLPFLVPFLALPCLLLA